MYVFENIAEVNNKNSIYFNDIGLERLWTRTVVFVVDRLLTGVVDTHHKVHHLLNEQNFKNAASICSKPKDKPETLH